MSKTLSHSRGGTGERIASTGHFTQSRKCCNQKIWQYALFLIFVFASECVRFARHTLVICPHAPFHLLGRNGNLDLHTSLNVDDDLLDNLSRGIEIDQTLVDPIAHSMLAHSSHHISLPTPFSRTSNSPHLIHIPSLTPLTTGRLPRRNLQILRRQPHGSLDAEILGLGALNEFRADFLQGGDFAGGESDADLVDLGGVAQGGLFGVLVGHCCGCGLVCGWWWCFDEGGWEIRSRLWFSVSGSMGMMDGWMRTSVCRRGKVMIGAEGRVVVVRRGAMNLRFRTLGGTRLDMAVAADCIL
jgi:hypothetical protein